MAARLNRRSPKPLRHDLHEEEHPSGQEPLDHVWQKQAKQARRRGTARKVAEKAVDLVSDILSAWP
jgi:hypothetical protein